MGKKVTSVIETPYIFSIQTKRDTIELNTAQKEKIPRAGRFSSCCFTEICREGTNDIKYIING